MMPAVFNASNNALNSAFVTFSPDASATNVACLTIPGIDVVADTTFSEACSHLLASSASITVS